MEVYVGGDIDGRSFVALFSFMGDLNYDTMAPKSYYSSTFVMKVRNFDMSSIYLSICLSVYLFMYLKRNRKEIPWCNGKYLTSCGF
jgi:hypothetical protein